MAPNYQRRYTPIDGVYEIWSEGKQIGVVSRMHLGHSMRWMFATDPAATQWDKGKYDLGYKTITRAVEALFAYKRGADGQSQECNDDEPRPNVSVAGRRDIRQHDNDNRRRRPKASTKGVGRKNRRGAGR